MDNTDFEETRFQTLLQVFFDHAGDIPGLKGVQVDGIRQGKNNGLGKR